MTSNGNSAECDPSTVQDTDKSHIPKRHRLANGCQTTTYEPCFCSSGEDRIRSRRFSLLIIKARVASKLVVGQRVNNGWLLVVTCGCFALLGVISSTLLAHFSFGTRHVLLASLAAVAACLQTSLSPTGPPASYCRYSSNLQSERSNADQRRKCQSSSERYGYGLIQEALEFADEAVSGAKRDRKGFNAMLAAARAGCFQVLFVENLSRLARDSIVTLETLKELVYVHHIRIISLDDGVDTANGDSWEILAAVFAMQNEQYLRALSKFVHRGLEGVVLDGYCAGDYCFGFS
jgi:hypothetical protein